MSIKASVLFLFIVIAECAIAEKTPLEVKESLYGLTNYWGKGTSTHEYYAAQRLCATKLKGYEDRCTIEAEWSAFFLRYLTENTPEGTIWMPTSGEEMLMASYSGITRTSTNCWLITAEYANELQKKFNKANLEFEQIQKDTRFDRTSASKRNEAWNRLVAIEKALEPTMYATTNSYPATILPTLSAEEGAVLYTNVLRRAGLAQ